jgi:hypothetical protein
MKASAVCDRGAQEEAEAKKPGRGARAYNEPRLATVSMAPEVSWSCTPSGHERLLVSPRSRLAQSEVNCVRRRLTEALPSPTTVSCCADAPTMSSARSRSVRLIGVLAGGLAAVGAGAPVGPAGTTLPAVTNYSKYVLL